MTWECPHTYLDSEQLNAPFSKGGLLLKFRTPFPQLVDRTPIHHLVWTRKGPSSFFQSVLRRHTLRPGSAGFC